MIKDLVKLVNGTLVECGTAYGGARGTVESHRRVIHKHGYESIATVDLMDEEGVYKIPVRDTKWIKYDIVGNHLKNYDFMINLAHFKGHPMGGFGGALKQLSIGCASSAGKAYIHGAGDPSKIWTSDHDSFLESMADAASSVVKLFEGKIAYISVLKNISVDCDCCSVAEDPCMKDIGIMASLDPVAIDRACLDKVYAASDDLGQAHFLERVESRNGVHTVDSAFELGVGTTDYELIEI